MSSDDLTSGSLEHQVPSVGGLQPLLQSTPPLPRPSKVSKSVRNSQRNIGKSWKILEILQFPKLVCLHGNLQH